MFTLTQQLSIKALEEGLVDAESVSKTLDALHLRLLDIRHQMNMFISILATLDENTTPESVYNDVREKVVTLKSEMAIFYDSYRKIQPVIRYFKIKQGLNPDNATKIIPHKVTVDSVALNESSKGNSASSDLDAIVVSLTSNVSTPLGAGSIAQPIAIQGGNSASGTPSQQSKKQPTKSGKRKSKA